MYRPHCDLQKKEIKRIQKEENMSLPQDIDYFSLPVSLSEEVREILDRVRPSTVSLYSVFIAYQQLFVLFWTENSTNELCTQSRAYTSVDSWLNQNNFCAVT